MQDCPDVFPQGLMNRGRSWRTGDGGQEVDDMSWSKRGGGQEVEVRIRRTGARGQQIEDSRLRTADRGHQIEDSISRTTYARLELEDMSWRTGAGGEELCALIFCFMNFCAKIFLGVTLSWRVVHYLKYCCMVLNIFAKFSYFPYISII